MEILKALRLLGDRGRVRILRLLAREELSVVELQEILGMGQSRISMQLSQLKQAGFVEVRRSGQKSIYRMSVPPGAQTIVSEVLEKGAAEITESRHDDEGLCLVLARRKDHLRSYFDELAGRFGRNYVPGRSWKALSEMLLRLLPPLVIADVGAGEGTLALLLAQRAERVIAVDSSGKMVEYGLGLVERHGIHNLEYRLGDMEDLPIGSSEVDLVLMHQALHHALHPGKALAEAWRVLRPGGRIALLDLLKHDYEAARELYGDVWLGFSQVDVITLLRRAGFQNVEVSLVDRAAESPHFETIMAIAEKPGADGTEVWLNGGMVTEKNRRTGEERSYTAVGMQALLDAVRSTGAKNVVVAGGLDWAYDFSGILAGRQLSDQKGHGVIYANHAYPFKGESVQAWIKRMETAARTLPVIVSEFGGGSRGRASETGDPWVRQVLQILRDHDWDWVAWDMHPRAGPTLISDWSYTPTPQFGVWVRHALLGTLPPYTPPSLTTPTPAPPPGS